MQFSVGFGTDIGRKRQQNQDNGAAVPELGLFVVADGMGGHQGGETASAIAVEVIPQVVREGVQHGAVDPKRLISEAIRKANDTIFEKAQGYPSLHGMGTTTTALFFHNGTLTIGQVGDSRCYFFRPNAIWQLTRDHSLVQEKLRAGIITREQAKTDRMKNVITRSVGFEPGVSVETFEMPVQRGDVFLVCSDGLSGLLEDPEMLEIVQKKLLDAGNIEETVKDLIAQANANGGDDNITAIAIQVLDASPS